VKRAEQKNRKRIAWYHYIGVPLSILVTLYGFYSLVKIATTLAPDFSIFYEVARNFREGISPYTNTKLYTVFNYPPVTGMLFMPLSFLSYPVAQGVFISLSLMALFVSVYLSLRLTGVTVSKKVFLYISALCFLSFPVKFTFGMGQVNMIAYMFLLLFLYMGFQKRFFWSGMSLALAVILKPILLVFILMFVYPRLSRSSVFFVMILLLALLLGFLLGQSSFYKQYLEVLMPRVSTIVGKGVYYNQNLIAFFVRAFGEVGVSYFLTVGTSVLLGAYLLYRSLKSRPTELQAFSYVTFFLLLANSITWQHHLMFLLLPMVYLFFNMRHRFMNLLVFFTSYFFISSNIKFPSTFSAFPHYFVLSHGMYGIIFLLIFFLIMHERFVHAWNRRQLRYNK
jgi:hypothetical protein